MDGRKTSSRRRKRDSEGEQNLVHKACGQDMPSTTKHQDVGDSGKGRLVVRSVKFGLLFNALLRTAQPECI